MGLYERDTSREAGMRLVPKLKFEHIKLTKSIHFKNDFRLKVRNCNIEATSSIFDIYYSGWN